MRLVDTETLPFQPVATDGETGCRMRELITDRDGAPTFAMRQFEIDPGGATPYHAHPWEHEVFVLAGEGHVRGAGGDRAFRAGQAVFVPPDELHSFVNDATEPMRMLCLIPVERASCR